MQSISITHENINLQQIFAQKLLPGTKAEKEEKTPPRRIKPQHLSSPREKNKTKKKESEKVAVQHFHKTLALQEKFVLEELTFFLLLLYRRQQQRLTFN